MNCGRYLGDYTENAVKLGKVDESVIKQALVNNYKVLMRLGFFHGSSPRGIPFADLVPAHVCSQEHQDLALEAAKQGIVLLHNDGTLPLSSNQTKALLIVGPNANATKAILNNYAGIPCNYSSLLHALLNYSLASFYNDPTIYPFGHGLSYTTFSNLVTFAPTTILLHLKPSIIHSDGVVDLSNVKCEGLVFNMGVNMRNTGNRDGTHVVLLLWKPPASVGVDGPPNQQLIGFERVNVEREVEHVRFEVDVCRDLSVVDGEGKRKLILGQHTLIVGASSERQVRHHFYLRAYEGEVAVSSVY